MSVLGNLRSIGLRTWWKATREKRSSECAQHFNSSPFASSSGEERRRRRDSLITSHGCVFGGLERSENEAQGPCGEHRSDELCVVIFVDFLLSIIK